MPVVAGGKTAGDVFPLSQVSDVLGNEFLHLRQLSIEQGPIEVRIFEPQRWQERDSDPGTSKHEIGQVCWVEMVADSPLAANRDHHHDRHVLR